VTNNLARKDTFDPECLYQEVRENYSRCLLDEEALSDTWNHTLAERGDDFTLEELQELLVPGRRANSWTRNLFYFVDRTIIDENDPICRHLLDMGQPQAGTPLKDIDINGQRYGSLYLYFISLAAEIIRHLDATGITHPRILEIGGGYGFLTGLLKAYFGARATMFSMELPESMMLQEWYLRSTFPDVPTCFKATEAPVTFQDGGLNFINANVYESQDFEFDVAINIISMCEMTGEVATKYIGYVEKNISADGIFLFVNSYGRGHGSVTDVPEYDFDEYWTLADATPLYSFEVAQASEMMRLLLKRTSRRQNRETRRFLLRFINNMVYSGAVFRDRRRLAEIISLPTDGTPEEMYRVACGKVWGEGDSDEAKAFKALLTEMYLPDEMFLRLWPRNRNGGNESLFAPDLFMWEIGNLRRRLISQMQEISSQGDAVSPESAAQSVATITDDFLAGVEGVQAGEYWAAAFATLLLPLGRKDQVRDVLLAVAEQSCHEIWLSRFAQLMCDYGCADDAAGLVDRARKIGDIPWFTELNLAVTDHLIGRGDQSQDVVARHAEMRCFDELKAPMIAKAALRIGEVDLFRSFCEGLEESGCEDATRLFIESVMYAAPHLSQDDFVSLVETLSSGLKASPEDGQAARKYAALLIRTGQVEEGEKLMRPLVETIWGSYFPLAGTGSLLYWCGRDEWAETCIERSLDLRSGVSSHLFFTGYTRMMAGEWDKAAENFGQAAAMQSKVIDLWGRAEYCRLPESVREARVFGTPIEQNMIFMREQDYYHDINPRYK
jgi:putative sugar O-methyltransferase